VHFKWKEREVQLTARSLDLTHPYFVSIKDLVFSDKKKLIINPAEDEITKTFGGAKHLMIPFQTVSLIEEMDAEQQGRPWRRFTLVDGREGAKADSPEEMEDTEAAGEREDEDDAPPPDADAPDPAGQDDPATTRE